MQAHSLSRFPVSSSFRKLVDSSNAPYTCQCDVATAALPRLAFLPAKIFLAGLLLPAHRAGKYPRRHHTALPRL
jgi:hypothetical protein